MTLLGRKDEASLLRGALKSARSRRDVSGLFRTLSGIWTERELLFFLQAVALVGAKTK